MSDTLDPYGEEEPSEEAEEAGVHVDDDPEDPYTDAAEDDK